MSQRKLLIIDTETGGLDPQEHSILTLGAVVWHNGAIDDEILLEIAEPEIRACKEALDVNGIDPVLHAQMGIDPLTCVNHLKGFLLKNDMLGRRRKVHLAGHNFAAFDIGFVKRLYRLAGEDYEKLYSYRLLDTQALALALDQAGRMPNLRSTGLTELCEYFHIPLNRSTVHNALEDARATAKLLTRMLDMIRK